MKQRARAKVKLWFVLLASLVFAASAVHAQATEDLQMTTSERLEVEPWWPTMSTTPLANFAGSAACTQCHTEEAAHATSMVRAATVAGEAKTLRQKTPLTFTSSPYVYSLRAGGASLHASDTGLEYSVADGAHHLSRMLDWVMGAGDLGQTFLYEADGHWYQSQATYYRNPARLDITTGLSEPGGDLTAALGTLLSSSDARRCFNCHTVHSTTAEGFNPHKAEAGLGCEACHGPGQQHVTQMAGAKPTPAGAGVHGVVSSAVFNPAKLSPSDSNDYCGACHRTFADVNFSTNQAQNSAVVRFQPYRLEESKCWRAGPDARLTCVACHNPHEPLQRDAVSYDRHCLQCHAAATVAGAEHAGKVCPKATAQCVSCHMPKVNVASMHGDFTDHLIRVVQPGQLLPR